MNIQPIKRSINYNEVVEWENNHSIDRMKYDDFISEMSQNGYSVDKINEMWLHNFGAIPPTQPDRIYQCNILDSSLKIVITLLRRTNILEGQKEFEVVKLNHLFLDTYDHIREFKIIDGKLVFNIIHKDLSTDLTAFNNSQLEDLPLDSVNDPYLFIENRSQSGKYPINYEDSNWFTSMAINDLLARLKVSIKEYIMPIDGEKPKRPTLFINNLDFMETTEFEFTDKEFEKALYEYIENKFKDIKSELK